MIDLNRIVIESINLGAQGYEEIYQNLRILYTTPVGTVPFDRNFGIDFSLLDNPLPIAKGKLIVEYINKTRKYESRAYVKEVIFEDDLKHGVFIPKVVIEIDTNIE